MQVCELPKPNDAPGSLWGNREVTPQSLAFSPDGRLLAAWDYGCVYVIDTHTGSTRPLWENRDVGMVEVPGVCFTADGKGVVADHNLYPSSKLWVHDLETGAVVRELPIEKYYAVEPGPGGKLVYVSVDPKPYWTEVVPWDPLTGKKKAAFLRHKGFLRQLAVSADGKWMAGSANNTVRVWNFTGPKPPKRAARQFDLESSVACVTSLVLSSDGAFVAACGLSTGVQVWSVKTGERQKLSRYSTDFSRELSFHPSRPLLAFSANTAEVAFWDAAAGAEVKRYAWDWGAKAPAEGRQGENVVGTTCFSPDGLRCAAAGPGKVVIWDVD